MDLAEGVVHHPAGHFGEPEIAAGKNAENCRDAHDHVEMADDEVRAVEIDIE